MLHQISVNGQKIEQADECVYLGQNNTLGRDSLSQEIRKRIHVAWGTFSKLYDVFHSKIPQKLKTRLFNQYVYDLT